MFKQLILFQLVFAFCICGYHSLVIKSGLNSGEAQQQHENADNHNVQFKVGAAGYSSQGGYDKAKDNKHIAAQDAGKYLEENAAKKQNSDEASYAKKEFENGQGGAVANSGHQAAHKKGHHKSGFHNTYHKDESGTNSSYYDDSDTSGDEYARKTNQNNYGKSNLEASKGGHVDENYKATQDAKQGSYNRDGSLVKESGNDANYNQEKNYKNVENAGKVDAGDAYDRSGGRYLEKVYYERPTPYYYQAPYSYEPAPYNYESPYYDSYYPQQKRIITVYEDPRIYEESVDHPQYERYSGDRPNYNDDDLIQLDVRPPLTRNPPGYYDRRGPIYENYPY